MSVKIAICDDSPADISLLKQCIYSYDHSFEISVFTNGNTLVDELLEADFLADIIFLDIYMPGINGIQTAQKIREVNKDVIIIFVSSSTEHYPEAYEVFAFNYILKPPEKTRLFTVLDRAIAEMKKESVQKICFTYKSTVYNVNCCDILYIESRDKIIIFHLADDNVLQCYGKLDETIKDLPEASFIRCHQSFIVNSAFITKMGSSHFYIGKVVISISKKYSSSAKNKYYAYLFSNMDNATV